MPKPNLSKILSANVIQSPQDDERFGLDWTKVKLGETVIQLDTKEVFIVINLDELDNPLGYLNITAAVTGVTEVVGTPGEIEVSTIATISTVSLANPLILTGKTVTAGTFNSPVINTPLVNGGTFNNPIIGTPTITSPTVTGGLFTNVTLDNPLINNAVMVAPALGTPVSGIATNLTGTALGLTAGNVITNANLTGDVTSIGNVTTLATVNGAPGVFGSTSLVPVVTVNAKGLVTLITTVSLAGVYQPVGNYITALTGDVTAAGPGSVPATLATVNANVGTFGSASLIPILTVDAKGRITAASTIAPAVVAAAAGTLTGTTLAANVVNASLNNITPTGGTLTVGGSLVLSQSTCTITLTSTVGTQQTFVSFNNTGGTYYAGVDNSAGNALGFGPYDFGFFVPASRTVATLIAGTGIVTRISASGLSVAGIISSSGFGLHSFGIFNGAIASYNAPTGGVYIGTDGTTGIVRSVADNAGAARTLAIQIGNGTNIALVSTTGVAITGALSLTGTITQAGTSDLLAHSMRSGTLANYVFMSLGRATTEDLQIGVAGAANAFVSGTAQGDSVLIAAGAAKVIHLGTNGTSIARVTPSGLSVTGFVQATGGLWSNGALGTNKTSSVSVDQLNPTQSRLLAWGPDAATQGTLQIGMLSSNASLFSNVGIFTNVGFTLNGTLNVAALGPQQVAATFSSAAADPYIRVINNAGTVIGFAQALEGGSVAFGSITNHGVAIRVANVAKVVFGTGLATFACSVQVDSQGAGNAAVGANLIGNGYGVIAKSTDNFTTAYFFVCAKADGSFIGSITRVGTTDAVAFNTTSDSRLKENVRDFTGDDSGRLIDGLKPRWFNWKDGTGDDVVGFLAQEEHAIDPLFARIGAVTVGDADPFNVEKRWQRSDSALVPILVAELKSVRTRLQLLEATGRN